MLESGERLAKGTNVRIVNFPPPSDPKNTFSWNGKIGKIVGWTSLGTDVNGWTVYEYDVYFPRVEIPVVKTDLASGRLIRSTRWDAAQNRFNVAFLELAPVDAQEAPAQVVEVPAPVVEEVPAPAPQKVLFKCSTCDSVLALCKCGNADGWPEGTK